MDESDNSFKKSAEGFRGPCEILMDLAKAQARVDKLRYELWRMFKKK